AVAHVLADRPYDLVLLAGDDTPDEAMFRLAAGDARMTAVRVGDGETAARYRLPSPTAFREFLRAALPGVPAGVARVQPG
ncbi:MAG TPA: hypothetical protein VK986_03840, partial [Tepidisphaeraceae bacterium]|nr:hypothetical protein [Tepidisphaeraceae bacterium]